MTSHLQKNIRKMSKSDRKRFTKKWKQVLSLEWKDLDILKLKGSKSTFRLRDGNYRAIFVLHKDGEVELINFQKRQENTYK